MTGRRGDFTLPYISSLARFSDTVRCDNWIRVILARRDENKLRYERSDTYGIKGDQSMNLQIA
jgi:hypothetical protein